MFVSGFVSTELSVTSINVVVFDPNGSTFVTRIEFMLKNNIIVISYIPSSENISNDKIPEWIKNSANWWSQEKIPDDEFVSSLKFLIREGIIIIN